MAANLFTETDYQYLVKRITALNENAKRQWGTMNVAQMVEHCAVQLKLGLGVLPQGKPKGSFIMRTWLGRYIGLYLLPWNKNLDTPGKMNMVKNGVVPTESLNEQKQALLTLLLQAKNSKALKPHPFFGALNQRDWGRLIYKHIDYHLKQFKG